MARKNSTATPEEEFEVSASDSSSRRRNYDESPLDARVLDLDDEASSLFLRGQKRVSVRRGALPRMAMGRLKIALVLIGIATLVGSIGLALYQYATRSWRFRIDSSDNIAISGVHNVPRSQVLEVMASDIDRNVFFVPLSARKKQLEQIPWVQSASVMRLFPNELKVVINERKPVAFVQINSRIQLLDANGVIMDPSPDSQISYSFPVLIGMTDVEPLSTRAARMKIYMQLMNDLDASGAHYSRDLSDVDLSDPDDVKATVTDPQGAVSVHLGSSNFLERFKTYVAHVQGWRAQFQDLHSVDLRYEHQVIVNPDASATVSNENNTAADAKAVEAPKREASTPKGKRR